MSGTTIFSIATIVSMCGCVAARGGVECAIDSAAISNLKNWTTPKNYRKDCGECTFFISHGMRHILLHFVAYLSKNQEKSSE